MTPKSQKEKQKHIEKALKITLVTAASLAGVAVILRFTFGEIVELFPKSDRNTVCTLHIKASDEDTLHKMVHSVQLDPSRAFILQKQTDEDAL